MMSMMFGKTTVRVLRDVQELGRVAAEEVAACLRRCLSQSQNVRMMMAGGESQDAFQDALSRQGGIDWGRVSLFQMDEFWCPDMPEELTVGAAIQRGLVDRLRSGRERSAHAGPSLDSEEETEAEVTKEEETRGQDAHGTQGRDALATEAAPPRAFHRLSAHAADAEAEARRYEAVLQAELPIDILCQGIGTSGHLAFNEPGCDLNDSRRVRPIQVCEQSRRQLMDDPNFKALGRIPEIGITTTIPTLLSARNIFTIVPLALKRAILERVLAAQAVSAELPATVLRDHEGVLFLDRDSCPKGLLPRGG